MKIILRNKQQDKIKNPVKNEIFLTSGSKNAWSNYESKHKKLFLDERILYTNYVNKINFLIKKKADDFNVNEFVQQGWISVGNDRYCKLQRNDLKFSDLQKIIKAVLDQPYTIFRHANSFLEYCSYDSSELRNQVFQEFQYKDGVFKFMIDDIEKIFPDYFNWNMIDYHIDQVIFNQRHFSTGLIEAIVNQIENEFFGNAKKYDQVLAHFEWHEKISRGYELKDVLHNWELFLIHLLKILDKHIKIESKDRNHFLSCVSPAFKISELRLTKLNDSVLASLNDSK